MNEVEFCQKWCGVLTSQQEIMLKHNISRGTFIGVGRPIGRMIFCPMILLGKSSMNVINRSGYYELCSIEGRKSYKEEENA